MKLYPRVLLCLFLALLLLASGIAWGSATFQDDIGACLSQPDGSIINLSCEEIIWVGRSQKSFAIKEFGEPQPVREHPRLCVVSRTPMSVSPNWACDLQGVLSTFSGVSSDGSAFIQRVLIVSPENVTIYCDSKDRPFLFPPFKGLGIEWPYKRTLAELSSTSTLHTASMHTMDEGDFPPIPDIEEEEPAPPAEGSRDSLKWLPDGAPVSVNGAIVSASFSEFFYVEKSDRSFGIWISAPDYVYEGQLVDITGRMGSGGGERAVVADQGGISYPDYNTYPRPLEIGMPNKVLGGGAVGLYTPAVADASGLNNTGLLVRAWGKVTAVDSQYPIFWIDDGSNITADGEHTGIKVYDTIPYDPLPSVNDYVTVSGVSAAEWPEGASASIRVIYKMASVIPSTESGSGTISGTITATGADGKTIRVHCASKSTTATFSGNTANYSLSVPYGDHAVTASLLGYKTITQLVTVSSGTPVDLDFTLTALERRIDVVSSPWRIPPDGTSEMTVTAIVRDEEGRRFGNESVDWDVDLGTVVSSDSTTDAVGEARLVLQAPSSPGTANVSVTVGGTTATNYAEFASATAPSVRILTPTVGETCSGVVTVSLQAFDPGGTNPGNCQLAVVVDGQPLGNALPSMPQMAWTTFTLANGTHTIQAAASDGDEEIGYSQAVTFTTSNYIHSVSVNRTMFNSYDPVPGNRMTTVSATQDQSTGWQIAFTKRGATTATRTYSGTGTTASATWDGTDSNNNPASPGLYSYTITSSGSGNSATGWIDYLRAQAGPITALLVEGSSVSYNSDVFSIVEDACEARNFQVITLLANDATWDNFSWYMMVYQPSILYVRTHGNYEIRDGVSCQETALPQVTQFVLKDSVVYAYRPQDGLGDYFDEYPAPGDPIYATIPDYPQKSAHYASELGMMYDSPLRLVWMDICNGGRIGAGYGNLSDRYNPYNVIGYNDLASELGIWENAWEIGATYCGFFEPAVIDDHYKDFLGRVFGSMKVGYSLDQAVTRDAWYDGRFTNCYGWINMEYGECHNERVPVPPYHNLRMHGNPWSTYLSP